MPRWKYDVFVSFRGKDIRKNFIDHLFNAFKQKGIHAFRDNIDLPRGEEIAPQLYKAIEKSRFLMVIFSKDYASSSWCLRELVKILNSKLEEPKHEVRIIFYDVKPEVVRKRTESYGEAFAKHEVLNRAEVGEWKEALSKAANLSGWDPNDMTNGFEAEFINIISKKMHKTLCDGDGPLHVGEHLVGLDARIMKLGLMGFVGSSKVNMIGICGISGIGKTTLAKAIYNKMYAYFEGSCFCEDVAKRHDLTQVQTQLINKIMKSEDVKIPSKSEGAEAIKQRVACEPILVVLDDVDHREQLEALAGSHHWFCPGSLIIFTGEDKQLLKSHGVEEIHETEVLDAREAIELFCLHAFRQTHPTHDFNELAYQVVKYMQGHPLALKVVGSALFEKHAGIWRSQLDKLQMHLHPEIQQNLRPSFDLLDDDQKRIFLDIAYSLIGENKDLSASVLSINYSADANIEVLVDKSLITISPDDSSLQMHELIRRMAREVVRKESDWRSRFWGPPEVYAVLKENSVTVTKAVEVLVLLLEKSTEKVPIDIKAFANMKNLRILKICHPEPKDDGHPEPTDFNVNFSGSLDFLSNELRLIYWQGYPFKFLPSSFYPENVVAIDLSYSSIKSFWTTPKCLRRLEVMKLRHCRNLITTPDFTEMVNLEELILEGCVSLVKLHPSIGMLKKLVTLNMRDCIQIRSFPCKVEMDSLQVLILSGCLKLDNLTQVSGTLKSLVKLYADGTAITEFPSFISSLTNLQVLEIGRYQQTESPTWWTSIFQKQPQSLVLPSLASLPLLTVLKLRSCNISEVCPEIGTLSCLEHLDLSGNDFTNLPGSLSQLSRLQWLRLDGCKKLEVLPELQSSIEYLFASQCTSLQEPPRLIHQHHLLYCNFEDCPKVFGNDRQVSLSQTGLMDSSTTSHMASTSQLSFLLDSSTTSHIQSKIREFFSASPSSLIVYKKELDVIVHGNRIPRWFRNKSKGRSHDVKVELPPNWCLSKFKGFGFCVVFTPKKKDESCIGREWSLCRPRYSLKNFDGASIDGIPYPRRVNIKRIPDTDMMIWLYFNTPNSGWEKAKDFVTFIFGDENEGVEVKECGVRLICEEDLKEEEQETVLSMLQHLPPQPTHRVGYFNLFDGEDHINFIW